MPRTEHTFSKNTFKEEGIPADNQPSTPKQGTVKKEKDKKIKKQKNVEHKAIGIIETLRSEKSQKITGLFLLLVSFFLLIAFVSYLFSWKADDNIFHNSFFRVLTDNSLQSLNWMGKIGAVLSFLFIKKWFGVASFLFAGWLFVTGMKLFLNVRLFPLSKATLYLIFGLLWISVCLSFVLPAERMLIMGGSFGYQINMWLNSIIGKIGTGILLFFLIISFLIIEYNIHLRWKRKNKVAADEDDVEETVSEPITTRNEFREPEKHNPDEDDEFELTQKPVISEDEPVELLNNASKKTTVTDDIDIPFTITPPEEIGDTPVDEIPEDDDGKEHYTVDTPYDPRLELSSYRFPGLDLLVEYDTGNVSVQAEELEANKNRILKTLNNYSIQIDKINATIGPTVTLYEIVPSPGVRIAKIKNLEDDIALSLSALGIRIIAPMPGKGTIGIEVPNQSPRVVSMRSILASEKFQNNSFDLPIGLGKTISNTSYVTDLAKMPHLLIAGATGQGKSVGLNAIIASLLYKKHPAELKFVLVDPKKVELTLFSKIERHYLAKLPDSEEAIITDVRKVVRTLNSLCILMESRYDLLKLASVRNIKEYNTKFIARKLNPNDGHEFMPYIVVIVDEFADLIMTAGKEVEAPITRLAQLARAIGIHLIVATQRPSVNVITGTIKANFPARVAYRVISKIDSRTILDTGGADQLIGRGDMLLSTGNEMVRLQCAFIDAPEVENLTDFIGAQRAFPDVFELPECPDEENGPEKDIDSSERDEMFDEAARVIVTHQHGSTSLLQRKLKLGYNRAGRIIDQLEAAGIVGPFEGSKAREVRYKDMQALEQFLSSLRNNN
ncbi:MAG TPA: DNA translocase FtsK [Bacteroidales bacterium]|nr:DNA translocase FtsK [Bacteroidales bacterium]